MILGDQHADAMQSWSVTGGQNLTAVVTDNVFTDVDVPLSLGWGDYNCISDIVNDGQSGIRLPRRATQCISCAEFYRSPRRVMTPNRGGDHAMNCQFFVGAMCGAIVGAVAALLLAPRRASSRAKRPLTRG
jgi:hypothetical protein